MVEDCNDKAPGDVRLTEDWLSDAQSLVPTASAKAKEVKSFPSRWKTIIAKLDQVPSCLSDLSSHPCFSKNALCAEQLQAVSETLRNTIELAELCLKEKHEGKLKMQSDLDSLSGKLDLNLRDCRLLMKTGVLGESTPQPSEPSVQGSVRELLARLQIGHAEAKHRALDALLGVVKDDERSFLGVVGRSNVAALVHLLTATSARVREKAATIVCCLADSGSCEDWLVNEGVLPPLIRLVESGSPVGREKALISLQRLSAQPEIAMAIVGHSGARPLIEICGGDDSVTQAAAASTLKNISAVPEARQVLVEDGVVDAMINLLDKGSSIGSKEYAAQCLEHLTSTNENLRKFVLSEGGSRSLMAYLSGPSPQEQAAAALRNLVGLISPENLVSSGLLTCLAHVLKCGSPGAQQAAASSICRLCNSDETKKLIGEVGIIPLLVKLLEAKSNGVREVAANAMAALITVSQNCREIKRNNESVPSLVHLLDPGPQNTAKKYAVVCLMWVSPSRRCRRLMVSYGAIGYLKKLTEMEVPGSKKLLERLERGRFRSLFISK